MSEGKTKKLCTPLVKNPKVHVSVEFLPFFKHIFRHFSKMNKKYPSECPLPS